MLASMHASRLAQPYSSVEKEWDGKPAERLQWDESMNEDQNEEELFGEATDGTWQCLINAKGIVKKMTLLAERISVLPFGLSAGMAQHKVVEQIGMEPLWTKQGREIRIAGWIPASCTWSWGTHSMRAEFSQQDELTCLTLVLSPAYLKAI